MSQSENPLLFAFRELQRGRITRREFMARAVAFGASLPLIQIALNSLEATGVIAQDATSERPGFDTKGQTRGAGGELKLLQWTGPTALNSHEIIGTWDILASCLVQEPLMSIAPDGSLLANLVTQVPSLDNGGLSEDLRTVTYHLSPGLVWSDGEPVTADDVLWTWQWIIDETNVSTSLDFYKPIESVEVLSPAEVTIIFREPTLAWFIPFTGAYWGSLLPKHIWDGQDKDAVNLEFQNKPIGTGPYKVDSFAEGHQVMYSINDLYREPNKPYFATVMLQSGGDGATAAQTVLQDGDWDLAWNVQVDPQQLRSLKAGQMGVVKATSPNLIVERIAFNFSDPEDEIDGERSSLEASHPFLTDPVVREAMTLAIDREEIVDFYRGSDLEPVAVNILTGLEAMESPNTSYEFDIARANQLLDDAGWTWTGDVRSKEGAKLSVIYNTAKKPARQRTQDVVKQGWESIGIRVQLGQFDGADFFASDPADDSNVVHYAKFYCDVEMFSTAPAFPMPFEYMMNWYAGPESSNVAQQSNEWLGYNIQRYVNPMYDELFEEATATTDATRAIDLMIQMNDILVNEFVVVPLVTLVSELYAISNRLVHENVAAGPWEPLYWNIANWRTVED